MKPLISLDVFDTALFRDVFLPTDLFDVVEQYVGNNFKKLRLEAQAKASRESITCNIIDIYKYLPQFNMKDEIKTELLGCKPNPYILNMYNTLDADFIFISDMYLPANIIKAMLQIEVGGINGLHNGIIDIGAINADPADEIAVFLIQCFVLGIGVLSFLQFRIKGLCGFAGEIEVRFGAGSVIDRFGGHDDQVFQFVEGISRSSGILGLVDADAACHNSNQQECGNQREIKVFGFH